MPDLPKPDTTYSNVHVALVRHVTPARVSDKFPAVNQPGQDSIPGTDSSG